MSSFLYRLGLTSAKNPWKVISAWILLILLAVASAVGFGKALDDAFSIPGTESQQGLDNLQTRLPQLAGESGILVFTTADSSSITEHQDRITEIVEKARELEDLNTVTDPFDPDFPGEISEDGTTVIANLQADPELDFVPPSLQEALIQLSQDYSDDELEVLVGGAIMLQASVPLSVTEIIGVFAALMVLAFTFKAFRSAFIPIITAITGLLVALVLMFTATSLFTISSTAPTLAVMLGLAVGIDYALFIIKRHLDQLSSGINAYESIARSIATSGSAVVFAGLTVIIALVGLNITQIPFLGVMGLVSAGAVILNVLAALTLLPAILGLFGDKLRTKKQRMKPPVDAEAPSENKFLQVWINATTKIPALTIVVVLVLAGLLTFPVKDLELGLPTQGTDPKGSVTRQSYDLVTEKYGEGYNATIIVTADIINHSDPLGVVEDLHDEISQMESVETIQLSTPNEGADLAVILLRPTNGPNTAETTALVENLRAQSVQWEEKYNITDVVVTGATAVAIDITQRLADALLPFGIFVVGLSLVLLAMVFRSIWVPIKAAVGFLISLGVAMGVTSMVFTYGWGINLLNIEQTGPVISFLPIIVIGVLFGLAMDYEVFLVTRMREEYLHSHPAQEAIKRGFLGSSPVVIAAAVIMVLIFSAFIPESTYMIQPIALALAVGVFVDAFIVRMTLVPAVLALLGDRAWKFPKFLDQLIPVLDVEGEGLSHTLEHEQWQKEHGQSAIRFVEVTSKSGYLFNGAIAPNSMNLISSNDPQQLHDFSSICAGRQLPKSGKLFIFERELTSETTLAQSKVEWVDYSFIQSNFEALSMDELKQRISRALKPTKKGRVMVINQAPPGLVELMKPLLAEFENSNLTIIASMEPDDIRILNSPSNWQILELSATERQKA